MGMQAEKGTRAHFIKSRASVPPECSSRNQASPPSLFRRLGPLPAPIESAGERERQLLLTLGLYGFDATAGGVADLWAARKEPPAQTFGVLILANLILRLLIIYGEVILIRFFPTPRFFSEDVLSLFIFYGLN